MNFPKALITYLLLLESVSFGFAPANRLDCRIQIKSKLSAHFSSNSAENDAEAHNTKRTCIKHFLTQRAIQSFMFTMKECGNPATPWFEDFSNSKRILDYHGTALFDINRFSDPNAILIDLCQQPKQTIIVEIPTRFSLNRRNSKNPYLPKAKPIEVDVEIDPPNMVSRIIITREHIAKELAHDIELVKRAGEIIIESYFDNSIRERDDEEYLEGERPELPNEQLSDNTDDISKRYNKKHIFDRSAMTLLLDMHAFENVRSTPLRKGTFDLLNLLATQESIRRILHKYKYMDDPKKEAEYEWLRNFYVERIDSHFDGNQNYGRAEDFFEELLLSSPTFKHQGSGKVDIVDPVGLAEEIISIRGGVADDWRNILLHVEEDHLDLRKNIFNAQMQAQAVELLEKTVVSDESSNTGFE